MFSNAKDLRLACRSGDFTGQTSGQAPGYAQANLCILPKSYAFDFLLFCQRNPKSCPLLYVLEAGQYLLGDIDIRFDVPKYRIYVDGVLQQDTNDVSSIWQDDFVTFVIGCSFSFEDAMMKAGLNIRHIEQNRTVPMYLTTKVCEPAGVFHGNLVVSMRPFLPLDAIKAVEITSRYPRVHGAPVHLGDPSGLGIADLQKPDFGEAVDLREGEIPVFWACGVTPQSIVMSSKIMKNEERTASIEEKLLEQYGGRGSNSLPQTLMFDHVSPATRLLEKRRQMFEVQEALNSQKEEFSRREDAFRRREDGLRRKDLELQESLIKFNKFLQENESKRNRALKRASEEKKQREIKEKEIEKLEAQLKHKLREEGMMKEEVEKNLKYQDYLENVVQSMSKFFPEISDILNRHKTLRDANSYLIEKHHADEGANDKLQKEYISFKKFKENQILNESNEIAEMQLKLEQGVTKTMRVQGDLDKVTMDASEKSLEVGQIISSVGNILARCEESFRIRHNKPHIDRSSDKLNGMPISEQCQRTKSKLDEIEMFMVDYKEIIADYAATHDFSALTAPKRGGGGSQQHQQIQQQNTTNGEGIASGRGDGGNHSKSITSINHDSSVTNGIAATTRHKNDSRSINE